MSRTLRRSVQYRRPALGLADSGEAEFDPSDFGTVAAWYDFSDITTLFQNKLTLTTPVTADGDPIGGVADLSGNSRSLSPLGDDALRPVYKTGIQNGLSVARFNADLLQSAAFTLNQPTTVFLVGRLSTADNIQAFFDGGGALQGSIEKFAEDWMIYAGAALLGGTPDTAWHVFTATFNGATSVLRLDGTQLLAGNAGTDNHGGITLGCRGSGAAGIVDGDIGEVLVFSEAITGDDLAAVEEYLLEKWGFLDFGDSGDDGPDFDGGDSSNDGEDFDGGGA